MTTAMWAIEIDAEVSTPFSAARAFLGHPVIAPAIVGVLADYARPATHRDVKPRTPGRVTPTEIRMCPPERELVVARWHDLGRLLASDLAQPLCPEPVQVHGELSEADAEFFDALRAGGLDLSLDVDAPRSVPLIDPEDSRQRAAADGLLAGTLTERTLVAEFERLLACGDSWTCLDLSLLLQAVSRVREPELALLIGQALGLQGHQAQQRRLLLMWADAGGLPGVRARHALADTYLASQDDDVEEAEGLLDQAAAALAALPQSRSVRHQRLVNRHTRALVLRHRGDHRLAAGCLGALSRDLREGEWAGTEVEVAVLVNASRTHAAIGRHAAAEAFAARAAHLAPTQAECHLDLARRRLDLGDHPAARRSAARACLLDPALPGARALYRQTLSPAAELPSPPERGLLPLPLMARRTLRAA